MANAIDEMRGGSVDATIASGNYRCRLDSGEGACRLYVVRPQIAGCTFTLPNPAYIRPGAAPNFTVINKGPEAIEIRSFGAASIYTLAVNRAVEIRILIQGVDWWSLQGPFVVSSGTALNGDRIPFVVEYTASSTTTTVLDRDIGQQYGYVRSQGPVAIQCTIKANVVLGSNGGGYYAFYTGAYPTGSTLLLTLESGAYITGYGGTGGTGQTAGATGMTAGTDGGGALAVYCNTVLVNGGRVQGGGGGGGGAARRLNNGVYLPGGSGGGGAGAQAGVGGPALGNPVDGSTAGQTGSLLIAGNGGQTNTSAAQGGQGGGPGQNGSAGQTGATAGAAGGNSGAAIGTRTGFTLTKLVTGTILGPEITL
jgi:hypothetical protein